MARTVQLACARCGDSQMYVVESAESDDAVSEIVRSRDVAVEGTLTSEAVRARRLELLPTSLPVGGIITPV